MDLFTVIFIVMGLGLLEIVMSADNAIINAEVLRKMSAKGRRWFVTFGIFISVFVVRGLLPWLIIYISNPSLGLWNSFLLSFSSNPRAALAVESKSGILLTAGGSFLILLFLYWFFLDRSNHQLYSKSPSKNHRLLFISFVFLFLFGISFFALRFDRTLSVVALLGASVFFIVQLIKEKATMLGKRVLKRKTRLADFSNIVYLEVLDSTFSFDGILGAFAFTFSIPLILIGNGIGAIAVRHLTLKSIDKLKRFRYLKDGAMYSIFCLGVIMIADSFDQDIPNWLSPALTFAIISYFFYKSVKELRKAPAGN